MHVGIDDLVPAIHALYVEEFGEACHFHLTSCSRCGGPTCQHPCICCGAWSDYSDSKAQVQKERDTNAARGIGSRQHFVLMVQKAGGLGALYFNTLKKVSAYSGEKDAVTGGYRRSPNPEFVRHVDALVERSKGIAWPDAGEVWDRVSGANATLPHQTFWGEQIEDWKSILAEKHGVQNVDEIVRRSDPRRTNPRSFPENCPEALAAMHEQARRTIERLGLAPVALDEPSQDDGSTPRM